MLTTCWSNTNTFLTTQRESCISTARWVSRPCYVYNSLTHSPLGWVGLSFCRLRTHALFRIYLQVLHCSAIWAFESTSETQGEHPFNTWTAFGHSRLSLVLWRSIVYSLLDFRREWKIDLHQVCVKGNDVWWTRNGVGRRRRRQQQQ